MRLSIHLLKLGFFIAALALTACSDKDTPGEIPPEVSPEVPEVDPPVPDGPVCRYRIPHRDNRRRWGC